MKHLARALVVVVACAGVARAEVKVEEKTKLQIEGVVGTMMNLFGGKAAKEGLTRTVAVKGDRRLSLDESAGELVDLQAEKVYRLDPARKEYKVVTFEELRKQHEKAMEDAKKARQEGDGAGEKPSPRENEMEVDLDVKKTGEKKTLHGFDTEQVIVTVTARKKGLTLEQGGGTVMTQDMWLAPGLKAQDEVTAFERRYYEKLYGKQDAALRDLALVAATTPGMGRGMEKLYAESGKLQGYPVLTLLTVESVKPAAEVAKAKEEESAPPTSLGGLFGSVAKKVVQTKSESTPRSTVLTSSHELLSLVKAVADADVALPAGYQAK